MFSQTINICLQSHINYTNICDEKLNNLDLFKSMSNQFLIIIFLTNNFILNTVFIDASLKDDIISEIIVFKSNILAKIFQIIDLYQSLTEKNSSKSIVYIIK